MRVAGIPLAYKSIEDVRKVLDRRVTDTPFPTDL